MNIGVNIPEDVMHYVKNMYGFKTFDSNIVTYNDYFHSVPLDSMSEWCRAIDCITYKSISSNIIELLVRIYTLDKRDICHNSGSILRSMIEVIESPDTIEFRVNSVIELLEPFHQKICWSILNNRGDYRAVAREHKSTMSSIKNVYECLLYSIRYSSYYDYIFRGSAFPKQDILMANHDLSILNALRLAKCRIISTNDVNKTFDTCRSLLECKRELRFRSKFSDNTVSSIIDELVTLGILNLSRNNSNKFCDLIVERLYTDKNIESYIVKSSSTDEFKVSQAVLGELSKLVNRGKIIENISKLNSGDTNCKYIITVRNLGVV